MAAILAPPFARTFPPTSFAIVPATPTSFAAVPALAIVPPIEDIIFVGDWNTDEATFFRAFPAPAPVLAIPPSIPGTERLIPAFAILPYFVARIPPAAAPVSPRAAIPGTELPSSPGNLIFSGSLVIAPSFVAFSTSFSFPFHQSRAKIAASVANDAPVKRSFNFGFFTLRAPSLIAREDASIPAPV